MTTKTKNWEQRQKRKGKAGSVLPDNVEIAWPVMLKLIDDNQIGDNRVLDLGCGDGGFCRRMRTEGLHVEGIDVSQKLIQSAVKLSSQKIRYHVGGIKALQEMSARFDVITCMMGFHFHEDFEKHIPVFKNMLRENGIVVFSVFNPEFVESCHREHVVFESLRRDARGTVARMDTGKGVKVDAYVRSKEQYIKMFRKHGFEYLASRYPPFTPEFVELNKWKLPSDDAEYLMMAVRKRSA